MKRLLLAAWAVVTITQPAAGQGTFTPGTREILALSFATAQPGQIPAGVRLVSGRVDVVDKGGVRMLRATGPAEFVVTLPEALPTDFTLEFDLVAKPDGGSDDLTFEGAARRSASSVSAEVKWSPTSQTVSGGGLNEFSAATPPSLSETLAGQLARIIASFAGTTLKLYTNGVRLYTLADRLFVRGTVLRVVLGGQDEEHPVYLARLRVAAGAGSTVVATQQSSMVTATNPASGGAIQPVGTTTAPATVAVLPAAPPPASAGAITQGPVKSSTRTSGSAVGSSTSLAARTITLPGFTAAGGFTSLAARTIGLPGFTATGAFSSLGPRSIALSGFTAMGAFTSMAPRTLSLGGFTATGSFSTLAPRTLALSGFTAAGVFPSLVPRTVTLSGFTAVGGFPSLAPRAITLSGFTAAGSFITLPPRTITLSGWAAVGVIP
jgi:hypothetical protein